jgi:ELWxxDGT repeat protein
LVHPSLLQPYEVNGKLLVFNVEGLYRIDGTPEGTTLIKAGRTDAITHISEVINDKLLFAMINASGGSDLWSSDGTPEGTTLLAALNSSSSAYIDWPTRIGDRLFFAASSDVGRSLWVTDGTLEGTRIVTTRSASYPMAAIGDTVFFFSYTAEGARELWQTDGTPEGTRLVADGLPQNAHMPTNVDGTLFFFEAKYPYNLWKSDGTAQGTVKVTDVYLEFSSSLRMVPMGKNAFFINYASETGVEVWKSDGTAAGTTLLKDIAAGNYGSEPRELMRVGDKLLFWTTSGGSGPSGSRVIWQSDGTTAGTTQIDSMKAFSGLLYNGDFTISGDSLFFVSTSDGYLHELWSIPLSFFSSGHSVFLPGIQS